MSRKDSNQAGFDPLQDAAAEAELARLYRKLPQADAEPDAGLDAAVLAMAHRALNPHLVATRRDFPRRRPQRWLVGLGSAASVVFAAGIAWQMRSGFERNSAADAMRESASKADVIAVTTVLHDAPAPDVPPPPPLAPAPPHRADVAANRASSSAGAPAAAAPARPAKTIEKSTPAESEQQFARAQELPRAPEPAAHAPIQREPEQQSAQPIAFPQAQSEVDIATSKEERDDNADGRERGTTQSAGSFGADEDLNSVERKAALAAGVPRDARARPSGGAVRPATQPAPSITQRTEMAAEPVATAPSPKRSKDTAIGYAGAATGTVASSAKDNEALRKNAAMPPDQWIKRIEQMLRDGKRDEAIDNLELFRERHPRHPLPVGLRDLHR